MGFLDDAKAAAGDMCGDGNEILKNIPDVPQESQEEKTQNISDIKEEIKELAGLDDEQVKACGACQGQETPHTCIG